MRQVMETIISDITGDAIEPESLFELSVKLPNGDTQKLDLSSDDYTALNLSGKGTTQKRRGRLPGSSGTGRRPGRPRKSEA